MAESNKSLERSIKILQTIAKENLVGVRELSRITNTSLAATERIVQTLETFHFIEKTDSGKIILGQELFYLGKLVQSRMNVLQIILKETRKLVEEINETVYLVERRGNHSVFLEGIYSNHLIQYLPKIGELYDLPYGATGKAFLSTMEEKEIIKVLDHYQLDRNKILEEIPIIRQRGYAISREERVEGFCGLAFPILKQDLSSNMLLDIAIPTSRYSETRLETIINSARNTIQNIVTYTL